jgi:hypothetical protein
VFADSAPNPNPVVPIVMGLTEAASMADDDRNPATARAVTRQPLCVVFARLASVRRTWDNNDHGCEGTPRNRYPSKATDSEVRLRS